MEREGEPSIEQDLQRVLERLPNGNPMKTRTIQGLPPGRFPRDQLMVYVAFMMVKVMIGTVEGDTSLPLLKTPGNVDEIWHAHLEHPEEYSLFCQSLGSDHDIPHCHEWANNCEGREKRSMRTDTSVHAFFGDTFCIHGGDMSFVGWDQDLYRKGGSHGHGLYFLNLHKLGRVEAFRCDGDRVTIGRLMEHVEGYGIPTDQQRVIFGERQLMAQDMTLFDCGIPHGATIYIVERLRGC